MRAISNKSIQIGIKRAKQGKDQQD